ncbi:hypothetical protein E4T39_02150 [Aureobasidium subglaciale]|nr:hypothetical protein E4T39_02150 [Aureobasidium subglaciale]
MGGRDVKSTSHHGGRCLVQLTAPTGNTAESTVFAQPPQSPEMTVRQFCDAIELRMATLLVLAVILTRMAGLKMPTKKQKTAANAATAKSGAASSASSDKNDAVPDISSIRLDGNREEDDSVEVYDSCDEIRKKIAAHLRKPGVTAAQFCRDLLAQYHGEMKPSQIRSSQLTKFRSYKGADTGIASCVFFEKMRLAEGKPKSKHRQEMEGIWGGEGGFDVTRGHHRGYYCPAGDNPMQDQFGRVYMVREGR